ncbi:MAG: hypothetical protein R6X07_05535, partial [Desulfatiglandales bacterium]
MPALNPADGPAMAYWPRGSEATRLAPGYVRVSGRSKRTLIHHQDIICCVTLPPEAGKHPSSLRRTGLYASFLG